MVNTKEQSIIFPAFIQSAGLKQQHGNLNQPKGDWLRPIREWLDKFQIQNPKLAKLIAKSIPAQCPFERDIIVFGRKIGHIPPMCKLNPLYDELVGLRFRALCYLVDECGEDIQSYC
jgi:hypothetical protein